MHHKCSWNATAYNALQTFLDTLKTPSTTCKSTGIGGQRGFLPELKIRALLVSLCTSVQTTSHLKL